MKKKKGFTLVELLAVIVILAIILVIAVPQIMDTIDSARDASLASSAKMVAAQAENQYTVAQTLGDAFDTENGDCLNAKWAGLNKTDYASCTYNIDSNGKASVTIVGANKFEGKYVCNGTRTEAEVSEEECTNVEGNVTGANKIIALANDATTAASNGLISANGIRYAGANSAVKNYIWFNCKDSDASGNAYGSEGYEYNNTNCELWRIIGVFDGRIKIVRDSTLTDASGNAITMVFDTDGSNVWEGSDLEVYLNDGETSYYNSLSTEAKAEIGTTKATWYVGAVSDGTADAVYANERTDTTGVENYVGLIYPSDYGYAGTNCGDKTIFHYYESCGPSNNWLKYSSDYWTISPDAGNSYYPMIVRRDGKVNGGGAVFAFGVRPSVYLLSNMLIKDGDGSNGTATSSGAGPYVIGKMS